MDFLDLLRERAFARLDATTHVLDMQGWMCDAFRARFDAHLDAVAPGKPDGRPLVVVEVGSWKGLSTITMARACAVRGLDARVVAVDTWLGAPEFWTWGLHDPTRGDSLACVHGYPSVFYTFTRNVKAAGCADSVCPLPISSVQGAHVLAYHGIEADVVYLDAAHEYDALKADLRAYWDLLRPGGVMFGDDYCGGWPGVVRAVDEFAAERGLALKTDQVVWSLAKPGSG